MGFEWDYMCCWFAVVLVSVDVLGCIWNAKAAQSFLVVMILTHTRLCASLCVSVRRCADVFSDLADTTQPRVALLAQIRDDPGSLHEMLRYFWKYDINLTRVESRPCKHEGMFEIFLDFHGKLGETRVDLLMNEVRKQAVNLLVLDERQVPWFPKHINDLDIVANRVLVRPNFPTHTHATQIPTS